MGRGAWRAWVGAAGVALLGCGSEGAGTPEPEACYEDTLTPEDLCSLFPDGCAAMVGDAPSLSDAVTVVPDDAGMPEGVVSQAAHNNLDIVVHQGRLFFAFRTAPSHYADPEVILYVVSTTDQKTWTLETSVHLNKDLREPRFLSRGDQLFLYFARLGEITLTFKPEAMMMTERKAGCIWTAPVEINPVADRPPSFIPWRARTIDGVSYLIGYYGGEAIYDLTGGETEVHWLTTEDGHTFSPVATNRGTGPDASVVLKGGSSETDFAFLENGDVIAVARNEAGEVAEGDLKFGSKICRAPAADLGNWTCTYDARKYDSPAVFRHGGSTYLVGRRHLLDDGAYDLMEDGLSPSDEALEYQLSYWGSPKRCSLWKVDPEALAVEYLLDLPSNGDTCFASVWPMADHHFLLYNYTSPLDDPDLSWRDGQFGTTSIYRVSLGLP